jgi:UDP-N-acetylglucosamine enolpyruvyl transferase
MANKVTIHFSQDRIERATYIAETVGFGEVIRTAEYYDSDGRYACQQITDTGVVVIRNDRNMLVTMYIAEPDQMIEIFHRFGWGRVPVALWNKVKKNAQKGYIRRQPNYHH